LTQNRPFRRRYESTTNPRLIEQVEFGLFFICLICCGFVVQLAVGFCGMLWTCCTAVRFVVDLFVDTLRHAFYFGLVRPMTHWLNVAFDVSPVLAGDVLRVERRWQATCRRRQVENDMWSVCHRLWKTRAFYKSPERSICRKNWTCSALSTCCQKRATCRLYRRLMERRQAKVKSRSFDLSNSASRLQHVDSVSSTLYCDLFCDWLQRYNKSSEQNKSKSKIHCFDYGFAADLLCCRFVVDFVVQFLVQRIHN